MGRLASDGRAGVVGEQLRTGAATGKDRSYAGERPELIGFPSEW
jgi:hypothetical protein